MIILTLMTLFEWMQLVYSIIFLVAFGIKAASKEALKQHFGTDLTAKYAIFSMEALVNFIL